MSIKETWIHYVRTIWAYHPVKILRSDGRVLIGDFRTLYNHVIFDHRQCPLFIFPNDCNGPVIYKYSKNSRLWTLDQCKFWTFHFPPLKPMYCREA